MIVYYRISDTGYNKVKPDYINNENCLKNFVKIFGKHVINVIADNISNETYNMILKYIPEDKIKKVSVGHGAGTFNIALDDALSLWADDDIIYFVENDYLHRDNADIVLEEAFSLNPDFVTLYDHPDKYLDPMYGGNPYCHGGSESTYVYRTMNSHWKITNSTTMTFAAKVKTLKKYVHILKEYTKGSHPYDFDMFIDLILNFNVTLLSPIPGYSTHGETRWLSPGINWKEIAHS